MKTIYFEGDGIAQIQVSNKPTACEASQDWHTHISYDEDNSIVEIVLLDAKKVGLLPLSYSQTV